MLSMDSYVHWITFCSLNPAAAHFWETESTRAYFMQICMPFFSYIEMTQPKTSGKHFSFQSNGFFNLQQKKWKIVAFWRIIELLWEALFFASCCLKQYYFQEDKISQWLSVYIQVTITPHFMHCNTFFFSYNTIFLKKKVTKWEKAHLMLWSEYRQNQKILVLFSRRMKFHSGVSAWHF